MLFIYINTAILVVDFVLLWLLAKRARYIFKIRYHELTIPKNHWSETSMAWIKAFVMFVCPVLNIIAAWTFVFKDDELCEQTVANLHKRCIRYSEEV